MASLSQRGSFTYLPKDAETRKGALKLLKNPNWSVKEVCVRYRVSRQSLWRWPGRPEGWDFGDLSHRPKKADPRSCTEAEKKAVLDIKRAHPDESYVEIFGKPRRKGFARSPMTVWRVIAGSGEFKPIEARKKKHDGACHTPATIGEKWQIDVKFVPSSCKSPKMGPSTRYCQYTAIDECSRKRFLYWSDDHSGHEAAKALRAAVRFFGCGPAVVQSDNGEEFCHASRPDGDQGPHAFETECARLGIAHKRIKPRTPEHNGKVERSHRTDQQKFYNRMSFYSLEDLKRQGAAWMKRYNDMPKAVLGYRLPNEKVMPAFNQNCGVVGC